MSPNPAQRINQFFSKHGSPVAGMGGFFVRAGAKFGVDPRLIAAIVMKETEGGKTGTGRPGQYNLTGVGGVGNMHSYPNYRASILDTAKNLGSPRYRGKPLPVQTAMWVAGTPPSASTAPYTRDVRQFMGMLGGPSPAGMPPQPGARPGVTPRPPKMPKMPGVARQQPFDATPLLQSLGQTTGVPWMLPPPTSTFKTPSLPGQPIAPGKPGKVPAPPDNMPATSNHIMALLHAAQLSTQKSPGYSKLTSRGPLKSVSLSSALDCSLSVAKVLQMAHLGFGPNQSAPVSGWMAQNWGQPGKGKLLTMYASNEHVFLEFKINGKFYRFDTSPHSDPDQRSGPRIRRTQRSTAGFTPRHWPGL